MSEEYEPRPNDHLVEPMFAGLGVEGEESSPEAEPAPRPWATWIVTLLLVGTFVALLAGWIEI